MGRFGVKVSGGGDGLPAHRFAVGDDPGLHTAPAPVVSSANERVTEATFPAWPADPGPW
jgi:hypothetical protein